jgi:hypothetical protein
MFAGIFIRILHEFEHLGSAADHSRDGAAPARFPQPEAQKAVKLA